MATIKVLVVGGGGGGGYQIGGGGGAGGYVEDNAFAVTPQSYSVTVGGGGAGATSNSAKGVNGSDSVFSTITAVGGGGGGSNIGGAQGAGANGGSGGGAGEGTTGWGNGTAGQGNRGGGADQGPDPNYGSGAGGGASAVGTTPSGANGAGGNGGAGTASSISGSSVTRAGGGGGGGYYEPGVDGLGGSGGGGNGGGGGALPTTMNGSNGTANTGGGGGGGGFNGTSGDGGAGGSGVVIIRYLTTDFGTCTGGTITTSGSDTIHTFTSSGTFVLVGLGNSGAAAGVGSAAAIGTSTFTAVGSATGAGSAAAAGKAAPIWEHAAHNVFNALDYGAVGNGTHDDTTNIQNAINTAIVYGGDVYLPPGEYLITNTLNLDKLNSVDIAGTIRLYGAGKYHTILKCVITGNVPALKIGGSLSKGSSVSDLMLRSNSGALPTSVVTGQYAIQTPTGGAGYGVLLERLWIDGFANHAILIQGDTGPTVIRDCTIQTCAGFGVYTDNAPQDVSIVGGSIQVCFGGIYCGANVTGLSAYETDIELGTAALYPCIQIVESSGGNSFYNLSTSMASAVVGGVVTPKITTPSAIVYCKGFSNTFIGGLNFAPRDALDMHNFWFEGISALRNTVAGIYAYGGKQQNGERSGYFANIAGGAAYTSFLPSFVASTYQADKGRVKHTNADNRTTCIGVPSDVGDINALDLIAINNVVTPQVVTNTHTVAIKVGGVVYNFLVKS